MNPDAWQDVQDVKAKALEQLEACLFLRPRNTQSLTWLVNIVRERSQTFVKMRDPRDTANPGFYFDAYLKMCYLMSGQMTTGPVEQEFGMKVLELMKMTHKSLYSRLDRQELLKKHQFLAMHLVEKTGTMKVEEKREKIDLLSSIYNTIGNEKAAVPQRLMKTKAYQQQYGADGKELDFLAYKIACAVMGMKFSTSELGAVTRTAVVGAESVGKSFLINHLGNPNLRDEVNGQGILPSAAGMGTQVICIVRDANQHNNEMLCRIGERSVDVDDDAAIYRAIKEESDRIKDLKAECARKKVKYDPGCDVEPMIAQSAFKGQPRNKPLTDIMDVPGLKPETLFQTVLAFAIATCLVLCARSPETLEADLVEEEGQLKELPRTLEMAGAISGKGDETLPVIVIVTRDVTRDDFAHHKNTYLEIARKVFPKSRRHTVLYGNCKELEVDEIKLLVAEFNNDLRQHKVEASSAVSKYNKLVPDLQTYLMVLQEGLRELMKEEEEAKKASGERKALNFVAFSTRAYESVAVIDTKHVKPDHEWSKFFSGKLKEFKDERAQHWDALLKKQILENKVMKGKVRSWPAQIKSMSELFYQCQFAALAASMSFGNDSIFYDSWRPLEGIAKELLQSPQDELCQGDHRKLCKLLAELFTECIKLASMDLEVPWDQLCDPRTMSEEGLDMGLLMQHWRANVAVAICDIQDQNSLQFAWSGYHVLMKNRGLHKALRPNDIMGSDIFPDICLFNLPHGNLERQKDWISTQLSRLAKPSSDVMEKVSLVSELSRRACTMVFRDSSIFAHDENENQVLKWLNKLYAEHLSRVLAKRNLSAADCGEVFTRFGEHLMGLIGCSSWENPAIKLLTNQKVTRKNKAKEMLKVAERLKRLKADLKDKLADSIGLTENKIPAMLSIELNTSMTFDKVELVAGSWHYNCEDLADRLRLDGVRFDYIRPPGQKPAKTLKECAERIQRVSPSVVVWFRTAAVPTLDPTDAEKRFMASLLHCATVTHVIIVVPEDKLKPTSPEETEEYQTNWVNQLPEIKLQTIKIKMETKDIGGITHLVAEEDDACQELCGMIQNIITSEAREMLQNKVDTYNRTFDCMCEEVVRGAKDSQRAKDQRSLEKSPDKFQDYIGSLKLDSNVEEDFASLCKEFHLPGDQLLFHAFASKGDFEEQICRKFMREIIMGQLIQQAAKFASKAYTVFVEEMTEEVMNFFTEGTAFAEAGDRLRVFQNSMYGYEKENGEMFDAVLELRQQRKRKEAKEAAEQFEETADTTVEDFQDFRTVHSFYSKHAYVSMYVGVVIVEATPLLEAMIMPLIQNGDGAYRNVIDDALNFYRIDSDVPINPTPPIRSESQPVWEVYLEDWTPYEQEQQTLIEKAYKMGRKELDIQVDGNTYRLSWAGKVWSQVNPKTKSARLIRRDPPPQQESKPCVVM